MALAQSALLEVLGALKAAEVDGQIRQAAETVYQALIEAELGSVIGALPHERTSGRTGVSIALLDTQPAEPKEVATPAHLAA